MKDSDVKAIMLTTDDNPFDPFTQWNEWYTFDVSHGYNTCAFIDRLCRSSDDLSPADEYDAFNSAINSILELNPTANYKKVVNTEMK